MEAQHRIQAKLSGASGLHAFSCTRARRPLTRHTPVPKGTRCVNGNLRFDSFANYLEVKRSRRSPITRSCPTATQARSWLRMDRSIGSACPASTRRAFSAACLTGKREVFASRPSGSTTRVRGFTSRAQMSLSRPGKRRPAGFLCATP
jgi:hypothetical protein